MKQIEDFIDFENSIGPWLGKTTKIIDIKIQEQLKLHAIDLTKEQMVVLKKLSEKDGFNQNELAILTLRNKSSLTRLVCKMEKKGLLIRETCKKDKRNKHLFITTLGKTTFKKTRPIIKHILDTMHQGISIEDRKQMIHLLQKIQQNFNEQSSSF